MRPRLSSVEDLSPFISEYIRLHKVFPEYLLHPERDSEVLTNPKPDFLPLPLIVIIRPGRTYFRSSDRVYAFWYHPLLLGVGVIL